MFNSSAAVKHLMNQITLSDTSTPDLHYMGKPNQTNSAHHNLYTILSWNVVSMPEEAVELFK